MSLIINKESAHRVEQILQRFVEESGATYVLLTDMGGGMLFESGEDVASYNGDALAVLSAANYAATNEIAKLIDEESFSLLFHRGNNENIHFTKVSPDVLMIVLFKPFLSLGLLRLKIGKIQDEIASLIGK